MTNDITTRYIYWLFLISEREFTVWQDVKYLNTIVRLGAFNPLRSKLIFDGKIETILNTDMIAGGFLLEILKEKKLI